MSSDLTQIPPQGHFADVNGMQMYYEVYGEGSPLLLLPGFTSTTALWQPFVSGFAQHFRVIVPDLRGHGRSLDPVNHFTFAQAALDVFALLDHLGIEQFRAIGISGGGLALQYIATWQPQRLDAIILMNCGYHFSEKTRTHLMKVLNSDDFNFESTAQRYIQGLSQLRSLLNQLPEIMDDFDTRPPDLAAIKAKTLIVWGDRDEMMSIEMPIEMYNSIPNAYLWVVPNAEHSTIIANPDKYAAVFTQTALEFLQDKW